MKKISILLIAFFLVATSFAHTAITVVPVKPSKLNANQILIPLGKNGEKVSLLDLSQMRVKELEAITGKKMKLTDKVGFLVAQKQLRNSINSDGSINNKKLSKLAARGGETGFHFGGFALGFFLGLVGILIAYLIKDDYKQNRVKWAWIGFGIYVVIVLVAVLASA